MCFVTSLMFFVFLPRRDEEEPLEQEVESDKEEVDSEEEMETCDRQQGVRSSGSVLEPSVQLSKEEERELKTVRKMDFSWVSSYIGS